MNKWVWISLGVAAAVGFLVWLFIESSKPLPGEKIADLGREHIEIGKEVEYNSNPPTSGPHYPDWVRAGVYETERDDRNLVHSLEHGYVVMSYRCSLSVIPADARLPDGQAGIQLKDSDSELDPDIRRDDNQEIATPDVHRGRNDECEGRKNQLVQVYEKKGKRKLIVVPRENLDTNFALTAWTYLDKFNPSTSSGLSVSDMERIEKFIDAHRDNGPERTME